MPVDQIEEEAEMSFLDHLEELRWHLVRSLIAIFVFTILAFVSKEIVFGQIILGPSKTTFWTYRMLCELSAYFSSPSLCIEQLPFVIQSREMTGQFSMHVTSSFVIGLICVFGYRLSGICTFVKPRLYDKEKKAASGATFFVSLLFMLGVFFGYFVVTPLSINFLANYQLDASILNEFDIISYVNTVMTLVLACAVLFQLPIVVYFATKAGLVSASFLKTYRKHAIVAILILGAIMTPPDPFSQIFIALPLTLLYEVGIVIALRIEKNDRKQELKKSKT